MIKEEYDIRNMNIKDIISYSKINNLSVSEFRKLLNENGRIIPVCYDRLFKTFMSSRENINFLVEILNYATGIDKTLIRNNLIIEDPFNKVDSFFDKANTSDLKITIEKNKILLEMNMFPDKVQFYKNFKGLAKAMAYDEKGKEYIINKYFLINFDYVNIFDTDSLKVNSCLYDRNLNIVVNDNIKEIHLLLANLEKMYYTKSGKLRSDIDINKLTLIERLLLSLSCTYIDDLEKLYEGLDEFMDSKREIERLNEAWKVIHEYHNKHDEEYYNELRLREAKRESRRESQKEIIQNMLNENMDMEIISKATKLSIDEINKIINPNGEE